MKWVRNVLPKYDLWAKRLPEIWFGCETSFWNMVWVRKIFLKYGLGAKRLSEIWFGCETSSWTMRTRAKRLSYLWGGGETSFLSMSWAKRLIKKWCELTMGRKVCVPFGVPGLELGVPGPGVQTWVQYASDVISNSWIYKLTSLISLLTFGLFHWIFESTLL